MADWFWPAKGKPAPQDPQVPTSALAEVRAYWEGLRDGTALPRRDQINPRGMATALDQVFVAERIGQGMASFRIAGMKINEIFGTEVRGLPLALLFAPAARRETGEALERVFSRPAIADLFLTAEPGTGRGPLSARLLLLPLIGTGGQSDLCLGCLATTGEIGRHPRRFTLTRKIEETLATARPLFVPETSPSLVQHPAFAEDQAAFTPRPTPAGKPNLRLVHSRR